MPALPLRRLLSALPLALVVAGCGHTVQVGASDTLRVAISEYRLNPQSAHAHPGLLTIIARNFGRLTHDLVVSRNGQDDGTTGPVAPGQSAQLTVYLHAGTYQLSSTLFSDQALGTYGTLTVGP